jgi:hypothetical protein
MYKDAARYTIFKKTGKFPMVTGIKGIKSLEKVLKEDTRFPISKQRLIETQGWKVMDLSDNLNIHITEILNKIQDKKYYSLKEILNQTLI